MIDVETVFSPLGGDFQHRFWPLDAEQIRVVEEATGWPLPDDYKQFVTRYGLCRPTGYLAVRRDDGFEPPEIGVIYGGRVDDIVSYAVDFHAGFIEDGRLEIATSDQGNFYLLEDGTIFFERRGAPMDGPDEDALIASSFTDFLERLHEPADPDSH